MHYDRLLYINSLPNRRSVDMKQLVYLMEANILTENTKKDYHMAVEGVVGD